MKLFGQYLIEKKIVGEEELLKALIQQIRELPTVVEIIFAAKLIPAHQILETLALQTEESVEFSKACERLGFWSEEIQKKVSMALSEQKIPLGQILVKNNTINFQRIVTALDEYLALCEENEVKTSQPISQIPKIESSPEIELLQKYSELLSIDKIQIINGLLKKVQESISKPEPDPGVLDNLRQLYKGIHEIRGMARFVRASYTESIVLVLENTINDLLLAPFEKLPLPALELWVDLAGAAIQIILSIKESLMETESEEKYFSASRTVFEKCYQDLESLGKLFSDLKESKSLELEKAA